VLGLGMGARVRHAGGRALKRFGGRDAAIAIGGRGGGLSGWEMPVLHCALLVAGQGSLASCHLLASPFAHEGISHTDARRGEKIVRHVGLLCS